MLEGLAAWVLNTYVGEYVENLNTDQLSIGLLQGQVELENLPLKKDALKKLELPIEVKTGFIGKICLQIPVRRLKSEPWVISMEKLYLVAGPLQSRVYDEAAAKKAEQDLKEKQLKELQEKWKIKVDGMSTGSTGDSSYSSWWSYGTSLASNIVENLQLKVHDVHLRYEDCTTVPGKTFACGVTIKSLSAQSTDLFWIPRYVSSANTDMMHKLLDLQNFSIYWDVDAAPYGDLPRAQLYDALLRQMGQLAVSGEFKEHDFILEPVSGQAKMKRNTSAMKLKLQSTPRIHLDTQLDKISFSLSQAQYRLLVAISQEFSRHNKALTYRRWRPLEPVKNNARQWWKFAINANLHCIHDKNQRRTKDFMVQRAQASVKYVKAYTQFLTKGGVYYMDADLKEHLETKEQEWSFEELKILRQVVFNKIDKEKKATSTEKERNVNKSASQQTLTVKPDARTPTSEVALSASASSPPVSPRAVSPNVAQAGLFQRWFPGWGGWYGGYAVPDQTSTDYRQELLSGSESEEMITPMTSPPASDPCTPTVDALPSMVQTVTDQEIEKEILDVLADSAENNTLLKRDVVFAQLKFSLKSGIFKLLTEASTPDEQKGNSVKGLEMECTAIMMGLESRPRTSGLKFNISIGGLFVRDNITEGSILPVLISPQTREKVSNQPRLFSSILSGLGRAPIQTTSLFHPVLDTESSIFEFTYDKKPLSSTADYKIDMKTKPLDIIYNADIIKKVSEFFTRRQPGISSERTERELAALAKSHYEQIKRETEKELKQTLDDILEIDDKIKAKRWDIDLDIAAPQFIMPESFTDKNTTIVMFDLGRLELHNTNATFKQQHQHPRDADEDDDFVTPSSSPPNELETEKADLAAADDCVTDLFSGSLPESAIIDRIYDKYTLNLSELQVMVGRAKDNWKHAHNKGTSHMHVVDKFSISLQLERRLLYTSDPQCPKMTLSGTLPRLTLHFNEQKMQSLGMVGKLLELPGSESSTDTTSETHEFQDLSKSVSASHHNLSKSLLSLSDLDDMKTKQAVAESRLILTQFCINEVSLEVQSRGRSIAELQVSGVKANFTKRPYDTSFSFTVHSLLVVDALQTFGPDFELLVASHRNLCLDSRSGSIRDSYPGSPQSPKSPESPSSPSEQDPPSKTSFQAVQAAVSNALQGLLSPQQGESYVISPFGSPRGSEDILPPQLFTSAPLYDEEALIRMEVDLISPSCPSNSSRELLQIANLQFNSLDVVANQQTIVELVAFFNRVLPKKQSKDSQRQDLDLPETRQASANAAANRLTVTADFHRLNVLLMRVEEKDCHMVAHKVATATLSKAKIEAEYAEDLDVKGSLGGLQLLDLTRNMRGYHHHQKILSVGTDPDVAVLQMSSECVKNLSFTNALEDNDSTEKALEMTVFKPAKYGLIGAQDDHLDTVDVTVRMASLCYTHSAAFIRDLTLCLSDFTDYMKNVGSTIKHAATEVAIGFVQGKELLGTSYYGTSGNLDSSSTDAHKKRQSYREGYNESMDIFDAQDTEPCERSLDIKLDVILQTPVLMIPRKPYSPEVLVIHLGKISIRNSKSQQFNIFETDYSIVPMDPPKHIMQDVIHLEIRDMNMYSMNLDRQTLLQQNAKKGQSMTTSTFNTPQPGGFIKTSYGTPILHDTVLELTIHRSDPDENFLNANKTFEMHLEADPQSPPNTGSVITVSGRIVTPLKLTLSKEVYEQLLQTLDHITPEDDLPPPPKFKKVLTDITEESDPDVKLSSLKFHDVPKVEISSPKNKANVEAVAQSLIIKGDFTLPNFDILMTGNLGEGEQGFLNLKLQDLKVNFLKDDPYIKTFELSLYSLVMEDLLESVNSKHRLLMVSSAPVKSPAEEHSGSIFCRPYLSTSCPSSMIEISQPEMPRSLPSIFRTTNVFEFERTKHASAIGITERKASECYPSTPPPSPRQSRRASNSEDTFDEGLVHIKVKLVDKKSPLFESKHSSTNRYIDVIFNCLDTTINLQTWVVLLDFLGMGAKVHSPETFSKSQTSSVVNVPTPKKQQQDEVVNSHINLKVQRLSLTMNKAEYELGKADINMFQSAVDLRDGNFCIQGQLGSMSILDESPHGKLYRERFITMGSQALDFYVFKYGQPDPDLQRSHDILVKLHMASVRYIHTQRFLQEALAFIQHFNQLQDVLGRSRAAAAGQKIMETAFRASRMSFDIEAGSPIILIPHSSRSKDILVMDLGTLRIRNKFLHSGEAGTLVAMGRATRASAEKTAVSPGDITENETFTGTTGLTSSPTSEIPLPDMSMTQSIYGSLESDWRNLEFDALSDSYGSSVDLPSAATLPSLNLSFQSLSSDPTEYKSLAWGMDPAVSGLPSPYGQETSTSLPNPAPSPTSAPTPRRRSGSPARSPSTPGRDPDAYCCLLDCMDVTLEDMDLFSAIWTGIGETQPKPTDLIFPSFVAARQGGKLLKEKCKLELQVERNLEGDISHAVPDFNIEGGLSSVCCSLDIDQYKLIRGLLEHNLGEPQEEYQRPLMSHLQDPQIQTVLSGKVWKSMSITLHLKDVTVELLVAHEQQDCPEVSLAKLHFLRSKLTYESFSDGSKDVDLVSNEIMVYDTRYIDQPANARPNVFTNILHVTKDHSDRNDLQMELHYRSSKERTRFTILLNNMRVMGIFDWLLTVKDFLLTSAENPFQKENSETEQNRRMTTSTYSSVSRGIVTKRAPVIEKIETPFELKLNVTDTELVCVESAAMWDTNAVILKSTAVFSLRPSFPERPVSCSLQSLEVFSCSLAAEDETAMSIIDPVTVTMELSNNPLFHQKTSTTGGLLDAYDDDNKPPILEVSFSTLNIRLSYNDLKLFMEILNSVPQQALDALKAGQMKQPPRNASANCKPADIKKLQGLGFCEEDSVNALLATEGKVDDAALWLTTNATVVRQENKSGGLNISGFEIKAGSVCFCLIDDCLDADVPLAELTFSNIHILQKINEQREGKASMKTTIDYYNRTMSGWEPFLESWGSHLIWTISNEGSEKKVTMQLQAADTLNLNVTSVLLEQYKQTKSKWTEDYYSHKSHVNEHRRRVPFVPFAIRNHTGSPLWFATVTTTPTRIVLSSDSQGRQSQYQVSNWRLVHPECELSFLIEEREKIRHKHTHELKVHQVVVKVTGWKEVDPVSVDKVGTYFRQAKPEIDNTSGIEVPPARVVFDVTLEGSAKKVITVRSALMLYNRLDDDVDIKLEDNSAIVREAGVIRIKPHKRQPIPLTQVMCRLQVRPVGWGLNWANKPIHWQHVLRAGEVNNSMRFCSTPGGDRDQASYRFCVSVCRQKFPEDMATKKVTSVSQATAFVQPGHVITLMPPVRVVNLLPMDMTYYFSNTDVRGVIKPGKTAPILMADLSQPLELGILLENYPTCKELVIPPGTQDYEVRLQLYDTKNRLLDLRVHIKAGIGGSLKLSVYAPFWLVNKTGLPLVFRQDNARMDAAGQFIEHEQARSVMPLLFSYSDKEANTLCSMRLGKSVHGPKTVPKWCHRFSLSRGEGVRQLHVGQASSRPDWVYYIGIEVRQGRGRYRDTTIVTFSPRYQLDNRTSYELCFAQRNFTTAESHSRDNQLSAVEGCKLSFHWPRVDLDQLLCAKVKDVPGCHWSGGFRIDQVNSFHINMRNETFQCHFLRVDIVLQGATFYIVFMDASHMPPPYRIDNFAEVPITYYQTKVADEKLRTIIKPHTSVPYALDEPTLLPYITLSVTGGSSAVYSLNSNSEGDVLCYENFFYIAFTGTMKELTELERPRQPPKGYDSFIRSQELVLDVLPDNSVVLKKREKGRRSQLWRMTAQGLLQHEGSVSPSHPHQASSSTVSYVLDIANIALQPNRDVHLMIRKADSRRRSTQTWKFEKGMLCIEAGNLCVQAKDGFFGLQDGGAAVLGPFPPVREMNQVPVEMSVSRVRMRPGSGHLRVQVANDGPTRVLQITDTGRKGSHQEDWVVIEESDGMLRTRDSPDKPKSSTPSPSQPGLPSEAPMRLQFMVVLPNGIGVSLVNHVPEEMLYISLRAIHLKYSSSKDGQSLVAAIEKVQVDNQLFGTPRPVLLHVTQDVGSHSSPSTPVPALQLHAHKMPSNPRWNADIYSQLLIAVRRLTVNIEEALLWKLVQFAGYSGSKGTLEAKEESAPDTQRALLAATSKQFKRYYFGELNIMTDRLALSCLTADDLPPDLANIKNVTAIPLVRFEDAKVELDPYIKYGSFETAAFLFESLSLHYTEELKSQAAKILGSVDFLGNPLGLFNDVTAGLSGLIKDGNVGGLIKNVTHGVSNTAAKVTGSLSDGVGYLMVDERHEKKRRQIRSEGLSGNSHLMAGIRGLGHGLLGGATSIVTQTYTGLCSDGFEGLVTGFGKGVIGTVTKPVAGMLDFASSAASAVRDTSRSSNRLMPNRMRVARCCHGPRGLLPSFSEHHARAQAYLFIINHNKYNEMFIAIEQLRFRPEESLQVLISSEQVYFLGRDPDSHNIVLQTTYDKLYHCRSVMKDGKCYIELTMKADNELGVQSTDPRKRPRIRCDTEAISIKVAQQINYAKNLFDELQQTLSEEDLYLMED